MDEQIEQIAEAHEWVVLPCEDRDGKHVVSWDICTNQPEPDAIGVGVVAAVYSGEATARAILAAVQAAGTIAELRSENARLREALKPFAKVADAFDYWCAEAMPAFSYPEQSCDLRFALEDSPNAVGELTEDDFAEARAALAPHRHD